MAATETVKCTYRLPVGLSEDLSAYATAKGVSVNQVAVDAIALGLGVQRDGVYISSLADTFRNILRSELTTCIDDIRVELADAAESLEDTCLEARDAALASMVATIDAQGEGPMVSARLAKSYERVAAEYARTGVFTMPAAVGRESV